MSEAIDTLKQDLQDNLAQIAAGIGNGGLVTTNEVVMHLVQTLWPFLTSVVENMAAIDEELEVHIEDADDILQPDTAHAIGAALAKGLQVAAELAKRIQPGYLATPADLATAQRLLAEFRKEVTTVGEILQAITIEVEEEEDDEDEEEEDEDDEEADDAEPEAADKKGPSK